jgi:hypothetical protein
LLLKHALFNLAAFINKLFLPFDLSAHYVKFGVFFTECIVTHLELLVKFALYKSLSFGLTLCFKHL